MTINRKLNPAPLTIEELRPGNMVRCFGVKVCGDFLYDPKHLIVTGADRLTGYVMLEWAGELPFQVKNPNPTPPFYFDKTMIVMQDVFHQEERHISEVLAIELWDRRAIHDQHVKSFGFIAHPGKVYTWEKEQHLVKLINTLTKKESLTVEIAKDGTLIKQIELWYIHELQNFVYEHTGCGLENSLTRRIMIDRPGKNLLSEK